jgi:hypothetical protein
MAVQTVIKKRRSTAAQWTSVNPVLAAGEAGLETDTGLVKHGDGTTAWNSLAYQKTGVPANGTTNQVLTKVNGTAFNTAWSSSLADIDTLGIDTTFTGGSTVPGQLAWNDVDGTLEFRMKGNTVTQQIGMEQLQLVKSSTNAGLTEGSVVYVVGSDGSNMTVNYAQANSHATVNMTLGVMTESASNGAKGFCTTFGMVHSLNTSAWAEGSTLWVSPTTAGAMTSTRPPAPYHAARVGYVIRSHASQGVIFVSTNVGAELDELHDVLVTSPADKNVLQYDSASSLWKNAVISAGVVVSDTAPTSPAVGDVWFNSTELVAYVFYDSAWIELSPAVPGPQGPAGPQGPTGATGPQGPTANIDDFTIIQIMGAY